MMALLASATTTPITSEAWSAVMTALTNQVSVSTVVGVLGVITAAGIPLVFMWWGVRKAVASLMAAFRKGRLKF